MSRASLYIDELPEDLFRKSRCTMTFFLLKISGIELVPIDFSSWNHQTPETRAFGEPRDRESGKVSSVEPSCKEWRVMRVGSCNATMLRPGGVLFQFYQRGPNRWYIVHTIWTPS